MEVNELDQLKGRLAVAQNSLNVDNLVHIQKTTLQQEAQPHWHLIIASFLCPPFKTSVCHIVPFVHG
jgi:hypothetical protein